MIRSVGNQRVLFRVVVVDVDFPFLSRPGFIYGMAAPSSHYGGGGAAVKI